MPAKNIIGKEGQRDWPGNITDFDVTFRDGLHLPDDAVPGGEVGFNSYKWKIFWSCKTTTKTFMKTTTIRIQSSDKPK